MEFDIQAIQSKKNYEEKKAAEAEKQRQNIEQEVKELSEQKSYLQEYLNRNSEIIRNWKSEIENKINAVNTIMEEYEAFASDVEKRYSEEVKEYILAALGDIPGDGPEMPEIDFNSPTTAFTSYNDEEYDWEL